MDAICLFIQLSFIIHCDRELVEYQALSRILSVHFLVIGKANSRPTDTQIYLERKIKKGNQLRLSFECQLYDTDTIVRLL